jgi:acyl-CoA reductase-like NAD-dependent aldehyde dehydrogenase
MVNGSPYGLCAGVYTKDIDRAHWLATRLQGWLRPPKTT